MEKENKSKKFWDYALLIVGGILILIPLLYTFLSSFKTTKQIMEHFFAWPNPWTTANFQRLFADGVMNYFGNSIIITVLSIVLVMIFVPMAAYSIARNMSKKTAYNWMYILLIIGIFVPFQVIMIPITVMMSKLGLANMWGLIILYLTYAVPQTLFLYVSYIKQSVPESLDEAAEIDGANKITAYFKIIFPLLK
ncbi:MAG: carbohydrate ABC transporter permease, partial [Lactobacillus amylovorus]